MNPYIRKVLADRYRRHLACTLPYRVSQSQVPNPLGAHKLIVRRRWHASSGLALQILERQQDIKTTVGSLAPVEQTCQEWEQMNLKFNQDDSGI